MPIHVNTSSLFAPKTIAVLGASASPEKLGNLVVRNLIENGFSGAIYPVNPRENTILGLQAYSKVADLPLDGNPLDLAVIALPAAQVAQELENLGKIHTKSALIISAGFKETGGLGTELELQLKQIAERYHIAVLGPNCLGLVNTTTNLNATFATGVPLQGNIGFFSQSGALCAAMFDWAKKQNIGFSSFISLGNKMVIDESDILAYLADDPATKVIVGYLESVENGQRFLRNAHIATRKKPVILLKAGSTSAGARAASSHTGALAGQDMAYEAAFRQTGIIRAKHMEDMFIMARAFASQPLPKGPGIAILTNAGGPGILATDACETAGLSLAQLSSATLQQLQSLLPSYASIFNPVDVVADATPQTFSQAAQILLADPAVHMLFLLAVPTAKTSVTKVAQELAPTLTQTEKPVFTCLTGGDAVEEGAHLLNSLGIPCFQFPEAAINAIATMYRQNRWKDNPMPVEINYRRDTTRAEKVIEDARKDNQLELVEFQAQGLLKAYEMPVLEAKLARTSDEACQMAKQLGFPVALKIASPQISHKTDVQGVVLNLANAEAVRSAFMDITTRAARMRKEAYIAGCLVQSMAPAGSREVIVGFKRDQRFGPLVLFGLGGIHVEAFKDISCRLAPLSLDDVHAMVREIKAFPILAGMRGQKTVKFTAIEDLLLIMSQMALDFPEIQEAECNPVLVNEDGAYVADIRVVLAPAEKK